MVRVTKFWNMEFLYQPVSRKKKKEREITDINLQNYLPELESSKTDSQTGFSQLWDPVNGVYL